MSGNSSNKDRIKINFLNIVNDAQGELNFSFNGVRYNGVVNDDKIKIKKDLTEFERISSELLNHDNNEKNISKVDEIEQLTSKKKLKILINTFSGTVNNFFQENINDNNSFISIKDEKGEIVKKTFSDLSDQYKVAYQNKETNKASSQNNLSLEADLFQQKLNPKDSKDLADDEVLSKPSLSIIKGFAKNIFGSKLKDKNKQSVENNLEDKSNKTNQPKDNKDKDSLTPSTSPNVVSKEVDKLVETDKDKNKESDKNLGR